MSGIAAVFHRDGAPASHSLIETMTERIAHRGPDGIHYWVEGPAALGHCLLKTLPEDAAGALPMTIEGSDLHITFDGRIDNRDDLSRELSVPAGVPDARVVLAAYQKWGESCPEHLLGDFAFVIWDARQQTMFCARDILGICPFYYFLNPGLILAASERAALFAHPAVRYTANEPVIAALLYVAHISESETIHQDVLRLPQACCMTVQGNGPPQIRRYWRIPECEPTRKQSPEDDAAQLWDVLTSAVRCRMRTAGNLGVLFSGGLDSTAVAAAVCEERNRGEAANRQVAAYSLVFPGWDEADESSWIRETADMLGLESVCRPPHVRPPGVAQRDAETAIDLADYPNDSFFSSIRTAAAAKGCRVLLTGMGGDDWMTGSDFQCAEALRSGHVLHAWRLASARAQSRQMPLPRFLWHYALRPLVPLRVVLAARAIRTPPLKELEWVPADFFRRTNLAERVVRAFHDVSSRRTANNHYFIAAYERGAQTYFLDAHGRLNAHFGVEARHPFHDRRLIECAARIPDEQKQQGDLTKAVLRRALQRRVPENVRNRTGKAHFTRIATVELNQSAGPDFWRQMQIAQRGWVSEQGIRVIWERLLAQGQPDNYLTGRAPWSLWRAFGLEVLVRKGLL